MRITTIALLAFTVLAGTAAIAQHQNHGAAPAPAALPSSKAYEAANARMHIDMAVKLTGDADVDFARSMVPHHQGAVDMARIVLEYGKDPELKRLAQDVIASQQKEIAFMREWLKKKGQ